MNDDELPREADEPEASPAQQVVDDESDTTRNWIPLTVLIISVPFMLILFVLIGYLICEWRHPGAG